MADASRENTPEKIAFDLLHLIAKVEQKLLYPASSLDPGESVADRDYILDVYADCLETVTGRRRAVRAASEETATGDGLRTAGGLGA